MVPTASRSMVDRRPNHKTWHRPPPPRQRPKAALHPSPLPRPLVGKLLVLDDENFDQWSLELVKFFHIKNKHCARYITTFVPHHADNHLAHAEKQLVVSRLRRSIPGAYWVDNNPFRTFLRVRIQHCVKNVADKAFLRKFLEASTKDYGTLKEYVDAIKSATKRIQGMVDEGQLGGYRYFAIALEGIREEYPCWYYAFKRSVDRHSLDFGDFMAFLEGEAEVEKKHILRSGCTHYKFCIGRREPRPDRPSAVKTRRPTVRCKHCWRCRWCGRTHSSHEHPQQHVFRILHRRNWIRSLANATHLQKWVLAGAEERAYASFGSLQAKGRGFFDLLGEVEQVDIPDHVKSSILSWRSNGYCRPVGPKGPRPSPGEIVRFEIEKCLAGLRRSGRISVIVEHRPFVSMEGQNTIRIWVFWRWLSTETTKSRDEKASYSWRLYAWDRRLEA